MTTHSSNLAWRIPWTEEPGHVMLMALMQREHSENHWASQVALVVKNPPANAGDVRDSGSTPRSGRSPGGGHGKPLQ